MAGSGQRAAGSGQRAAGSGQRAAGSGQRAAARLRLIWCAAAAVPMAACGGKIEADVGSVGQRIENGTLEADERSDGIVHILSQLSPVERSGGTGILLTPRWVLTVAHVLDVGDTLMDPSAVTVRLAGGVTVGEEQRTAELIVRHPSYNVKIANSGIGGADFIDVALVKLTEPFTVSDFQRSISGEVGAWIVANVGGLRCFGFGPNHAGNIVDWPNEPLRSAVFFDPFLPPNGLKHMAGPSDVATEKNAGEQQMVEGDSGGPCFDAAVDPLGAAPVLAMHRSSPGGRSPCATDDDCELYGTPCSIVSGTSGTCGAENIDIHHTGSRFRDFAAAVMGEDAPEVTADLDGDGTLDALLDVVVADGQYVIDATLFDVTVTIPTFVAVPPTGTWVPVHAEIADFDGDDVPDIDVVAGDEVFGILSTQGLPIEDWLAGCGPVDPTGAPTICELPSLNRPAGVSHLVPSGGGSEGGVRLLSDAGETFLERTSAGVIPRRAPRGFDFDGDGLEDFAVGAPGNGNLPSSGRRTGTPAARSCPDLSTCEEGACCLPSGGCSAPCAGCCDADGSCRDVAEQSDLACGDWTAPGGDCRACDPADGCAEGDCFRRGEVFVFRGGGAEESVRLRHGERGLVVPPRSRFGSGLAWGDFDGDGRDELLVASTPSNALYYLTFDGNHDRVFSSSELAATHRLGAGDFDGDEVDDAVVGRLSGGNVVIPGVLDEGLDLDGMLTGFPAGNPMAGDFDCDGREDLAIGTPWAGLGEEMAGVGVVKVFYAGPTGLDPNAVERQQSLSQIDLPGGELGESEEFGFALAAGNFDGDVNPANGQPCVDLAVSAIRDGYGLVHVIPGGPARLDPESGLTFGRGRTGEPDNLPGEADDSGSLTGYALAVGRVDGDRFTDLLLGAPDGRKRRGHVYALRGSAAGLTSAGAADWDLEVPGIYTPGLEPLPDDAPYLGRGEMLGRGLGSTSNGLALLGAPRGDVDGVRDVGFVSLVAPLAEDGFTIDLAPLPAVGLNARDALGHEDLPFDYFGTALTRARPEFAERPASYRYALLRGSPALLESGSVSFATDDTRDLDGDGFPDVTDNCPELANADQADTDDDGLGDACQCAFAPPGDGSLQVEHRDGGWGATADEHIKPHLSLQNLGTEPVALKDVELRYWYTNEGSSAQVLSVDSAAIGNDNVSGEFVRPHWLREGANSYLVVRFSDAAGLLLPGGTTGPIELRFNTTAWDRFDEANDYSYADRSAFAPSSRITVYVRGDLVWGEEPTFAYCSGGLATLDGRMHVTYAARDPWAPGDASVMPRVVVYNDGVASVNLSELGVRYWFTAESTSPLQAWVDYAALGNQNVTTSLQTVSPARPDADRYLSVGFAPSAGALVAGANTGPVELRFNASSWQALTETNDYSYSAQANGGAWPNVTLYRQGQLVWGVEP